MFAIIAWRRKSEYTGCCVHTEAHSSGYRGEPACRRGCGYQFGAGWIQSLRDGPRYPAAGLPNAVVQIRRDHLRDEEIAAVFAQVAAENQ